MVIAKSKVILLDFKWEQVPTIKDIAMKSWSYEVMVPKLIFAFFAPSDPEMKMGIPKSIGFQQDPCQASGQIDCSLCVEKMVPNVIVTCLYSMTQKFKSVAFQMSCSSK